MREASLNDINKFLACKRVALVGLSRNPRHLSRALFREFAAQGYEMFPVNPQATEIEGRQCFTRLAEVPPPVQGALLMTGTAEATQQALDDCKRAGVGCIWIYKAFQDVEEHERTVQCCRTRGAAVIEGYCPFMFLPHPELVHRLHRFFVKITGAFPQRSAT